MDLAQKVLAAYDRANSAASSAATRALLAKMVRTGDERFVQVNKSDPSEKTAHGLVYA